MNELDVYYRALTDYRKSTDNSKECVYRRKLITRANPYLDKIEMEIVDCTIDDDWIETIERGLEDVREAIGEDRQFITSNGEVLPIEKVKSFSKDSAEHLARHSNLITRLDKDKGIVPDKLYTVERLSDYAVYENRFLYMLLCYLRDFITVRYEKIVELTNTYNGRLEMHKVISTGHRRTEYEVRLTDIVKNDPYFVSRNPVKDKVDRIELLLKTVLLYLSSPLMEQVAKAPMLKPPITETNVLRMNKHFKGAKELYYYVSTYSKTGYNFEKKTKTINPFGEEIGEEFAEVVALSSFLAYEHNLGLKSQLKEQYLQSEEEKKAAEEKKKLDKLAALRKRVHESGKTDDEYMLILEERIKILEKDSMNLATARDEIESMTVRIDELKTEVIQLSDTVAIQKDEIERANDAFAGEVLRLKNDNENRISTLEKEYKSKINEIESVNSEKIKNLTEEHSKAVSDLQESCNDKIDKLTEAHADEVNKLNNSLDLKIANYEAEILDLNRKVDIVNDEKAKIVEAKLLSDARLNALRKQYKLFTPLDDFTSEESFNELERQYKVFSGFFKGQWKKVKRKIRRELLSPPDDDDDD